MYNLFNWNKIIVLENIMFDSVYDKLLMHTIEKNLKQFQKERQLNVSNSLIHSISESLSVEIREVLERNGFEVNLKEEKFYEQAQADD